MLSLIKRAFTALVFSLAVPSVVLADQVLIIDAQYSTVTANVKGRLEAAGHTVTVTTNTGLVPTDKNNYQQVWDLRYSAALTAGEQTAYQAFVTAGGFVYFVTENPGCCMARNNSVAALVTALGGGTTQIGPGWANNVNTNMNTTYMTQGITVNYLAVAAIVNSSGIPLISDAQGNVSGMSWIGRAGALNSGVTGTIVTVADTNWLAQAWGTDNQQALDDIIRGIVAGTVGGTISASGNGAAASNGAAQQQAQNQAPSTFDHTNTGENVQSDKMSAGTFTGNGGTLTANSNALTIANNIALGANGMTYDANNQNSSLTGVISGAGGITFAGAGTTTVTGQNTYTGPTTINTGATLVNTGSIASSSLLTNNGTFTNSGIAGDWYNAGIVNNTGTMANGTNVGTFTNAGTVGTVTNNTNGTFTNNGTTAAVANNATFTNNAGATTGAVANTGTFTNAGTTGALTDNTGTFTNTGTAGDWLNNGTVVNSGTMGNGTNNGTFTNTGAVGTVVNTGTFANTGTLTSMNNTGTFATTPVTLSTYTQSSPGNTVLDYGSQLTVTGPATLGGGLTMLGTAPGIGKYTVLTGNGVSGTYDTYTGAGVLRYTPTSVQYWIMPDSATVQSQVNNQANNISNMNQLASSALTGSLGTDCGAFGEKGGCMSVNYGSTKVGSGDLNTTGVTIVKSIDEKLRVGVFGTQQSDASVGGIKYTSRNPAFGVLVGWNESADGIGYGVTASAVKNSGDYAIGADKAGVKGEAYQVKVSFSKPTDEETTVIPYVGLRYSKLDVGGYTETGPTFPLTFNGVTQTATDLIAGVSASRKLADGVTGTVNAGVVQNLAHTGAVTATGDMGNYTAPLQGSRYTSAAVGVGLQYEVDKGQKIGVNAGWQQKGLTNSNINSVGVSYTIGF